MSLIFVDTGAFYALADRRDPCHDRARQFYQQSVEPLLTTDFIFAETMSLLTKRLDRRLAVAFGEALRDSMRLRIEEPSTEEREAAWRLFSGQADKDYDLVDCVSFAVMETLGIRRAFGFDLRFVQYGFELVPRRPQASATGQ